MSVAVCQYIFHEGESANEFYVVRYGQVALEVHDQRRGQVTLQTLHEGDVLGWSWLFAPYKWHYGARSLTLVRAEIRPVHSRRCGHEN